MSVTLKDCQNEFRQLYPDCADGIALQLVRGAYKELCDEYAISVTRTQVPLIAGVARYTIPDAWGGLRSVAYRPDADPESAEELLSDLNVEDLMQRYTLSRFERADVPREAMVDAGDIVLNPPPMMGTPTTVVNGVTVYGFPVLDIEATTAPVVAPNAPLPSAIRDTDAIVYRAAKTYASRKDQANIPTWQAMEMEATTRLERFAARINRQRRPQQYPEGYYDMPV